ncbi:hypothetical protein [Sphingopyxis terrae]|uniref:hypothetical protein n=1 Tax=Sphingopyxis terrae TaxID=33052 RepID=UPI003F80E8E4
MEQTIRSGGEAKVARSRHARDCRFPFETHTGRIDIALQDFERWRRVGPHQYAIGRGIAAERWRDADPLGVGRKTELGRDHPIDRIGAGLRGQSARDEKRQDKKGQRPSE